MNPGSESHWVYSPSVGEPAGALPEARSPPALNRDGGWSGKMAADCRPEPHP